MPGGMLSRGLKAVEDHPPPGPFRRGFWRSPLRGPWLTAVFGAVLLVGITVLMLTGLLSYTAYNPDLRGNDVTPGQSVLEFYTFAWPTQPSWLYWFTQGVHVLLGIVLVPVVLAKLWSVIPKLFDWPPATSPAQALERASLLLLVGGVIFVFATGIIDIQYWYAFPGSFYRLHYYGAWVFIGAFVLHVAVRLPRMVRALRERSFRVELRTDTAHTQPEAPDEQGLVAAEPEPATISRRGALAMVGASSVALFGVTAGQIIGGPLRSTALLAPRGRGLGEGPNDFQINKSVEYFGLTRAELGPGWRLDLSGPGGSQRFGRADLLALAQHEAELPIACVEGWSTGNQLWRGVRLADLARLVGAGDASSLFVESVASGGFGSTSLRGNQIRDPDSLLALGVNGAAISPDHGFPARVIVPNNPGVHNTKWVQRMTFEV